LTFFLTLFIVHPALGDPATQQQINRICHQNEDYGFCNKTFNENLKGPADDVGLVLIANNQVLRNTSRTSVHSPREEASCRPPTPDSPLVERKRDLRILIAMDAVAGHVLAT
ncbi:uncharacterized protein LOC105434718, partial [Cucumis sativus]|uniref:uncharacterized protein LOC105434718 n=1 Tax=Cucumis sativus TaxID=3659 RepID=UPI0012F49442